MKKKGEKPVELKKKKKHTFCLSHMKKIYFIIFFP